MAKAPKSGDDKVEDAELIASVDATGAGDPLILAEPEQPTRPDETGRADDRPQDAPTPPAAAPPASAAPPQRPSPQPRQGGVLPLLLGGALAAGLGFAAAQYGFLGQQSQSDPSALQAALAEQAAQIAALTAEVERLSAAPAPTVAPDPALADRIAAVESEINTLRGVAAEGGGQVAVDLSPLNARVQALEDSFATIATLPGSGDGTGIAPAALAALQVEIDALKAAAGAQTEGVARLAAEAEARITEAEARAAALSESMVASAQAAATRAALGRLQAALETGAPFQTALADLGAEVPAVLAEGAAQGLPTLADLQDSFPAAARAALEAALRANMGESWTDRVSAFLRTQTGARSLSPREGSDPDAILSRAEAALVAGDVTAALAETRSLPEAGLAAMADWLLLADQRLAAEAAVADLVTRLGN